MYEFLEKKEHFCSFFSCGEQKKKKIKARKKIGILFYIFSDSRYNIYVDSREVNLKIAHS